MKIKIQALIGIAAIFAISLVTPLTGYQIKAITEALTLSAFQDALDWIALLGVTYLGINLVKFLARLVISNSVNDSINKGRLTLFEKASSLPYSDIEELKSSKIKNIVTYDSGTAASSLVNMLKQVSDLMQLMVVIIYISILDYRLGLSFIVVLVIGVIANLIYVRVNDLLRSKLSKIGDARDQYFTATFQGFQQWFPNGTLPKIGVNAKSKISESSKLHSKDNKQDAAIEFVTDLVMDGGLAFAIYLVTVGIINGYSEIGNLSMIIAYTGTLVCGFYSMTSISTNWTRYKESKSRINEIMKRDSIKYGDKNLDFTKEPEIKVNIESFSYPMAPKVEVLKDLDLEFKGNGMYSIVSESGYGKSTIFRLLTRLYDSYKGQITINGTDVKCLTHDCLKSYIYMINQQPYFCDTTIRENFLIEVPEACDQDILEVCKKFDIIQDILASNQGLDTVLGESGLNLSGGQKQLLSIAKMILRAKYSRVLLLDEATSALDGEHQEQVLRILSELSSDHMIIMINHRLSMNIYSTIYYIENNEVHIGSHRELMKLKSYRKLYKNE